MEVWLPTVSVKTIGPTDVVSQRRVWVESSDHLWDCSHPLSCLPLLPLLQSWPGCFQILGPLSKELKIRAHTDLQKKQSLFIWSKAIVQIKEVYTVRTNSRPDEWEHWRASAYSLGSLSVGHKGRLVSMGCSFSGSLLWLANEGVHYFPMVCVLPITQTTDFSNTPAHLYIGIRWCDGLH